MITPFFIQFFENKNIGSVECALLFAAPHLVYLMTAPQLGKWVLRNELSVLPLLAISFLLQAGFVFALAFADRLSTALILRLGFGFFMTLALVCFHEWMSRLAKEGLSAEGFGRLDSISRFCGIAGGALVGLATLRAVPAAPFYLGSLSFLVAAAIATLDFEGIFLGRNVELISRARSYPKIIELCSKGDAG
ncbi:MAG: hypothetical protein HYX67_07505 [Candidatus Melainabacteria bacterium]|nr:hypothetical protein [Candidatus Melainabacteria bacterium]